MFIHFVATNGQSLLRLFPPLYKLVIYLYAHLFSYRLSRRAGIRFTITIRYGTSQPELRFYSPLKCHGDWPPQFHFGVRQDKRGILLYSLKFPVKLRQQGLGLYCVKWLKLFCKLFGFQFIVLGCYPEAEGFWRKMDFIATVYEDWKLYWN